MFESINKFYNFTKSVVGKITGHKEDKGQTINRELVAEAARVKSNEESISPIPSGFIAENEVVTKDFPLPKSVPYHIKIDKFHLNRKMRRFLKAMGWGVIPPRTCHPKFYQYIEGLMNSRMSISKKREIFNSIL